MKSKPEQAHPQSTKYLATYSLGYLGFGLLIGSLGPFIPFLAEQRHRQEHEFSSLFMARTLGAVLALLSLLYIKKLMF